MKYQTQKVAMLYFYGAIGLFVAQILFGVVAATIYVLPNTLSELLPFNIVRMIHTNALVVWLLMGFMGSSFYLLPEETETELYSPKLAIAQFWIFLVAAAVAVVGYMFRIHEGREFLEQPFFIKVGIVLVVLMFLFNITMTALKGRKTTVINILLFGLWGLAIFFLFAFYNPINLALDKMYWWYVIHLWVEGVWELIMASILAFLMIKLNGIDREVVEKWLYVIVGLALFSGILGTGHHYYWIGAPGYWQWIGSLFSTLEVAPFFTMVIFTFVMTWKAYRKHENRAALLWSIGCSVMAFFGSRRLGLPAHAVFGELLHPRHAADRRPRPPRLLRRLCDAEPCDDGLCHTGNEETRALQSVAFDDELLGHVHGHVGHDLRADLHAAWCRSSSSASWAKASWMCRISWRSSTGSALAPVSQFSFRQSCSSGQSWCRASRNRVTSPASYSPPNEKRTGSSFPRK